MISEVSYMKTVPQGATIDTIALQIGEPRDIIMLVMDQLEKSGKVKRSSISGCRHFCGGSCCTGICLQTDTDIYIWIDKL